MFKRPEGAVSRGSWSVPIGPPARTANGTLRFAYEPKHRVYERPAFLSIPETGLRADR